MNSDRLACLASLVAQLLTYHKTNNLKTPEMKHFLRLASFAMASLCLSSITPAISQSSPDDYVKAVYFATDVPMESYVGKQVMVRPISSTATDKKAAGYEHFFEGIEKSQKAAKAGKLAKGIGKAALKSTTGMGTKASSEKTQHFVYEPIEYRTNAYLSNPGLLSGKTFTVIGVVDQQETELESPQRGYFLKLQGKDEEDIAYYRLGDMKSRLADPVNIDLVATDQVEAFKSANLQREFYCTSDISDEKGVDGNDVTIEKDSHWKIVGVELVDQDKISRQRFLFKMEDDQSQQIWVSFNNRNNPAAAMMSDFLTVEEYKAEQERLEQERLEKERKELEAEKKRLEEEKRREEERKKRLADLTSKYGAKWGPMIAQGKIEEKMTEEMVLEAWGQPASEGHTEMSGMKSVTWMYSGKTVNFIDGKVAFYSVTNY